MNIKRKIIRIDEEKCTGCGLCVPSCKEGALKIIDGKARLVSDTYCDGLGSCIGECPFGALFIEEKETAAYTGPNKNAVHEIEKKLPCGCPGSSVKDLSNKVKKAAHHEAANQDSMLSNWPIKLALMPINASYLKGSRLVVLADCCGVAYANLHNDILNGKVVTIGCPKLDDADLYISKLADMIMQNDLASIDVVVMEVPCCRYMVDIVEQALKQSGKAGKFKVTTIGIDGGKCVF